MLMPSDYQERHQNGLDRSTESTIKYLRCTKLITELNLHTDYRNVFRKHQYAPEFQKHARLYEVCII